jgi:hypothetical protein
MCCSPEGTWLLVDRKTVLLSVVSFAVGFCLIAALLGGLVRDPMTLHADMRSEKLALLERWRGRADAAVFGSSHVHNGFDPRAFDAVLASTPLAAETLNLGIEGGAQTEQHEMALRFVRELPLHTAPSAHPLVMLELNAGANLTNDHLVHPRSINLYDWSTTRFAWTLVAPGMSRSQIWGRRVYALAAWMLHLSNFGMISSEVFAAPLDREQLSEETANDRRGLLVPVRPASRQGEMARSIQKYSTGSPTMERGEMVPAYRQMAEDLSRNAAQPGLHVAYIVTPRLNDLSRRTVWPPCIATSFGPVPILALNRPDVYPELYRDPGNWTDEAHLTERGAQILGKHAAEQWLTWNQSGRSAAGAACGS